MTTENATRLNDHVLDTAEAEVRAAHGNAANRTVKATAALSVSVTEGDGSSNEHEAEATVTLKTKSKTTPATTK